MIFTFFYYLLTIFQKLHAIAQSQPRCDAKLNHYQPEVMMHLVILKRAEYAETRDTH